MAKSYELEWDKKELKLIYQNLVDKNFIELIDESSDEVDYILFSNILYNGRTPNSQAFNLNMDNIQTKYFYDLLEKNSQDFTLDDFLKIFKNKHKSRERGTIEASASTAKKRSGPKNKEDIESVFKRLR